MRYENDGGTPFKHLGKVLAGNTDRFRTGALMLSYKDYNIGFRFFTGKPSYRHEDIDMKINPNARYGTYINSGADEFRLSEVYVGYKGYSYRYHNEVIRGAIQNKFIHNNFTKNNRNPSGGSGWFQERQDLFPSRSYFQFQSINPYSLW